jgi:hypothetical protein
VTLAPDTVPLVPDTVTLAPDTVPLAPDTVPLMPDTVTLAPDTVPLVPDTVTLAPDTVPLAPDTVPLVPDTVTLAPDTVPLAPDTVPLMPDTVTLAPDTVPLMPDSSDVLLTTRTRRIQEIRGVLQHTRPEAGLFKERLGGSFSSSCCGDRGAHHCLNLGDDALLIELFEQLQEILQGTSQRASQTPRYENRYVCPLGPPTNPKLTSHPT